MMKLFKTQYPLHLQSNFMELPPRNPTHHGFPTIPRACLNFPKLLFIYFWQICLIFNNSCTIVLNNTKPFLCTPTHQNLSNSTENMLRTPWFGRFQHDKQNKTNYLP